MDNSGNVFLIGPAGAGKTTVGRLLAEQLGLQFLDTDAEIEERSGVDIAWIFDIEGEEGFRDREEKLIQELTTRNGVLLATGGGVVLREANRKRLISRGTVIYLQAPIEQQLERTSKDKNRPLLSGDEEQNRQTLKLMDEERGGLYRDIADVVFKSEQKPARALAIEIANHFFNRHEMGQ